MAFIFETNSFEVVSHDKPFVSREDGGHIKVVTKTGAEDRTKLTPQQAIELMRLTTLVGEAMFVVMNDQGIPVVKINYEDLGNWAWKKGKKPHLHVHIFGRAKNAVKQVFPEAVYLPARETGFYDDFNALTVDDIQKMQIKISELELTDKYLLKNWGLKVR